VLRGGDLRYNSTGNDPRSAHRRRGDGELEFIDEPEVLGLLKGLGISAVETSEDQVHLRMADGDDVVRLHLTCGSTAEPDEGARVVEVSEDRLAGVIDEVIHRLHLSQVVLVPIGKWRKVFDAVAFSLTSNEEWQEFDTAATVELNTRDPLLCGPVDYTTVNALFRALLSDAETPDQGLMLTSTASPVLIEAVPDGAIRISLGNRVLADELTEVVEHTS